MLAKILIPLALFFLPPLYLLLFNLFKNRRLVWLTIPAVALTDTICFWNMLTDHEWWMPYLLTIIVHLALLSASTASIAHAKRPLKKRAVAILLAIIFTAALGYVTHTVLSDTSDGYRQFFDRPAFTQLTQIQPEDVVNINAFDRREKNKEHYYKDYHGDKTFFADLEYAGSLLSKPGKELTLVADVATNSYSVRFTHHDEDIFRVEYRNRVFYVKSPQLLADIT